MLDVLTMTTISAPQDTRFWYAIGAASSPDPKVYVLTLYAVGHECRRAYVAGIIARLFGVDLTAAVT